jgi:putative tryptophan/tyrosine transport system substrate-binding protein
MMQRREFIAGLGSAAAGPLAARAQRRPVPVIGYLSSLTEGDRLRAAFRQGLSQQGYVEGQNVEIVYRWAETRNDRLPALAAELVSRQVYAIFANGVPAAALAAKSATSTVPIIFATGADPVKVGLVASLNRPGGNATGVSFPIRMLVAKRLELLHEIVPAATTVGFLDNPTLDDVETRIREVETAARVVGVHLAVANARTPGEIEKAFAMLVEQRMGALLESGDPLFTINRVQVVALAARHGVPAIYADRDPVESGGLMSYGPSLLDAWRLAGTYVGRILKGEKPADLPVQQSTRFEFVLNLKTAKALGLNVPTATLLRADEVIE